ncbi:MAG: hypothetical protein HYT80_07185 [Euryarchaeota archaeon]|nr:hypothetical protein [Euryarchaeota archaeon]
MLLAQLVAGCLSGGDASSENRDSPDSLVTDEPDDGPAADDGTHIHDYWGDAREMTLLEARVPVMVFHNHLFDEPPREQHTHGCDETLASSSQGGSVKFSLQRDQIVYPGTSQLEFAFRWTSPSITGLKFLYRPPNQHDFVDGGLVANGKPVIVPLTPEMADAGHATKTLWGFFLCAKSGGSADLAQGDVDARVTARRADVIPRDPKHPDHWENQTTLPLGRRAWSGEAVSAVNKGDTAWIPVPIEHGVLVPMGTRTIWVNASFNSTGPLSGVDPGDILVYYRDSTVADWIFKAPRAASSTAHFISFEIRLTENMHDGIYGHETNWEFWLRLASQTRQTAPSGLGYWGAPHQFVGNLEATVVASQAGEYLE